jgi:hypothetical protein
VPGGPPAATLRLIATSSEVGLASYLVDFAGTMGIARYRSQTAAIAYVTKVPLGKLVGQVVQVCQVPDGFPIPERLQDPRTTPPPLPDAAEVAALSLAAAAALGPADPGAARELLVDVAGVELAEAAG